MAEERSSLGSGGEPEHISWVPGIEGRGLPASWTWWNNEEVRRELTLERCEFLMDEIATEGHLLRYMVSNARRDNVPFMIWLQDDYWEDYNRRLQEEKEERQQDWETERRDKGYVDIAKETSRIILTNLSGRTRTVCLRDQERNRYPHSQDTYYTIRPYQTDIMCFCTGLLIEEDLDLSMIEVIPFTDPNDR